MSCYDELTLSIHADSELPPDEARELRAHLATCAGCRAMLAALQVEAHSLQAAFAEVPLPRTASQELGAGWSIAAGVAAVLGVAVGLDWLQGAASLAKWIGLDPLDPFLALDVLARAALHSLKTGVSTMSPALSISMLMALMIAVLRSRRTPARVAVAVSLLALGSLPNVEATEFRFRHDQLERVVIGPEETIADTLITGGDSVMVQGTVDGDLISLGREIRIEGKVTGSLICLSKRLEITGSVAGDVYTLNETLVVRGSVGRSIHSINQRTELDPESTLHRDIYTLAEEARIAGSVGRNLRVTAKLVELAGAVGGKAKVEAERVVVADSARITGDLVADVRSEGDA